MKPKVSVITPVYKAEKYLKASIDSVLSQTMGDFELILIHDKSPDNSIQIIQKYQQKDPRVKLIDLQENSGSGVARNLGIEAAQGKYIAFLDSDDIWHPEKLKIQIELMEFNEWDFSHTSYGYLKEDGSVMSKEFHVSTKPVDYFKLLRRTEISCLTAVYCAERIGKFYMTEHKRKQDYALWLSILKFGVVSYPIGQVLAYYRQRPSSATSNKLKLVRPHFHFLKETQEINSFLAAYYTCRWMLNGIIRYYIK